MEIDIKENRAKTAGKTEMEKAMNYANVTKEPPFAQDIHRLILQVIKVRNMGEARDAVRQLRDALREAVQYYSNQSVKPGAKISGVELPIIALANKLTYQSLNQAIESGQFGQQVKDFDSLIKDLSRGMHGVSLASSGADGGLRKFEAKPEESLERVIKEITDSIKNASEVSPEIQKTSERLGAAMEAIAGGPKIGEDFKRDALREIVSGTDKGKELADALVTAEAAWGAKIMPPGVKLNNFDLAAMALTIRRLEARIIKEVGDTLMYEALKAVDAVSVDDSMMCLKCEEEGGGSCHE